jgi:asparagine synthase (glutamine-hydrolysing)
VACCGTVSGIVGIVRFDGAPVERRAVERMAASIAYRGCPALRGTTGDSAVLAQLHHGTPPRQTGASDGGIVVVADARLDNADALAVELNVPVESGPGGTVLLLQAAFERWGAACAEHLTGAFAFCVWDARRRTLFCARDHLGAKPFVYAHLSSGAFVFGSDIGAVLAAPDVQARVDERRLGDYLLDIADDLESTFFAGVRRLAPAHTLVAGDGVVTTRRYWSPDPAAELRLGTDREYADVFRTAFARAVERSVRGAERVGVMLSGGLDSSAIACVAGELLSAHGREPPDAFTVVYGDDPAGDERGYAQAVIDRVGMHPHFVRADRITRLEHNDALIRLLGEPFENPGLSVGWAVQELVHDAGVRVVLDGTMGDTAVSYDFRYLADLARKKRFLTLAREAVGLSRNHFEEEVSPLDLGWRFGLRPWLRPPPETAGVVATHPITRCLHPGFARRLDLAERQREYLRAERAVRSLREWHIHEVTGGAMARSVEVRNRISARFGIEDRHPYFDKDLLELCVALPREQRVRDGWTRFIVRNALSGTLPERIRSRGGKWTPNRFTGAGVADRFGPELATLVRDEPPELAGIIDWTVVRAAYQRLEAEQDGDDVSTLWCAVNLRRWFAVMKPGW